MSAFLISWQPQYKVGAGETGEIQKEEDKRAKRLKEKNKRYEKGIGVSEEDKTQREGNEDGKLSMGMVGRGSRSRGWQGKRLLRLIISEDLDVL